MTLFVKLEVGLLLFGQESYYSTYDTNDGKNCRPSKTEVKYRFVAETNHQENTN